MNSPSEFEILMTTYGKTLVFLSWLPFNGKFTYRYFIRIFFLNFSWYIVSFWGAVYHIHNVQTSKHKVFYCQSCEVWEFQIIFKKKLHFSFFLMVIFLIYIKINCVKVIIILIILQFHVSVFHKHWCTFGNWRLQ